MCRGWGQAFVSTYMYVMFTTFLPLWACSSAVAPAHAGPKRRRTAPQSGCPHYKPDQLEDLSELALAEVQDIEQLVARGRGLGACPYYSSRKAVSMAEVGRAEKALQCTQWQEPLALRASTCSSFTQHVFGNMYIIKFFI